MARRCEGKAQACILLWLEGGPSQMDTWDPKANSNLKPIATRVPGIQISELFPRVARQMDKLSVIRSVHTEENNHPQGTYQALTGHRPNAAMKFPSLGSIICKETGPRNELPQYALVPQPTEVDFFTYADAYSAAFLGANYNPMIVPDPSQEGFHIPDLRLPKTITAETIEHRQSFLKVVDRLYREKEQLAEFGKMDALSRQALGMLLSPNVEKAFDLSQEPDKVRDAYGRNRVGQSVLLARRLIESGCRFVSASGYRHGQWDTHGKNDENLRKDLAPLLDQTLSVLLADLEQPGPARDHGGPRHGRVWPHADHQPPAGPRPLARLLVAADRRRRHRRAGTSSAPATRRRPTWPTGWSPWATSTRPSTRRSASTGPRPT